MSPPPPSCETKKAFEAAAAAPPPSGCGSSAPAPSSDAVTDAVACAPKIKVKVKKSGGSAVPGGGGLLFPSGYGFVVLTAVGSIMMVTWKSLKVGIARDEFKIPYPQMYTSDNVAFNCVLRAHQNTMENYPQFLLMLMIGGLEMPYFCSLGGWIWIFGRIMYAKGYYTGDPNKRARGNMSVIGMVMLLAATAKFAIKHLRG